MFKQLRNNYQGYVGLLMILISLIIIVVIFFSATNYAKKEGAVQDSAANQVNVNLEKIGNSVEETDTELEALLQE